MRDFAAALIDWQRRHGRRGLPWQGRRDPYRVWLAEIMLQQTRVGAVIPYYERFVAHYPDVAALARAPQEEVLALWSGLGYYARARNLLAAARIVVQEHAGRFPKDTEDLQRLPGIGRSTAGAIAACAFGRRAAILDGNVMRVLARCFGVTGYPGEPAVARQLWALAESLLPRRSIATYTQALMDLGAAVCRRTEPRCERCPVADRCVARREKRIGELPVPRPRRALPQKRAIWLVLVREHEVLLERRPPSGLWGGLWAFPELPGARARASEARTHSLRMFGCEVSTARSLAPIEHGFTHFRLQALPIRCNVRSVRRNAQAPGRMWLALADAARAAVPAPVKSLLLEIARDAGIGR